MTYQDASKGNPDKTPKEKKVATTTTSGDATTENLRESTRKSIKEAESRSKWQSPITSNNSNQDQNKSANGTSGETLIGGSFEHNTALERGINFNLSNPTDYNNFTIFMAKYSKDNKYSFGAYLDSIPKDYTQLHVQVGFKKGKNNVIELIFGAGPYINHQTNQVEPRTLFQVFGNIGKAEYAGQAETNLRGPNNAYLQGDFKYPIVEVKDKKVFFNYSIRSLDGQKQGMVGASIVLSGVEPYFLVNNKSFTSGVKFELRK